MADIDSTCPMDRVLTDETRAHIMGAYRGILSAPNSSIEESELAEDLPLDVDVFLLSRLDDTVMHAEVLIDWEEHPPLVADEVVDCPHHAEGDELSTLGELGEAYADLEADLMEVAALMCDLPESEAELEQYVTGPVAFQLTSCYEGLLTFAFGFRVADGIVRAYQDCEHELGEQVGSRLIRLWYLVSLGPRRHKRPTFNHLLYPPASQPHDWNTDNAVKC